MASAQTKPKSVSFDIDHYLNPFIPRSPLHLLPTPISRFLGYRKPTAPPEKNLHVLLVWFWGFIGAFCGVTIIESVFRAIDFVDNRAVPIVIGSFGAAAILEFNTIESPLAQPRNLVLGHFFSALVGVCITKLFALLPPDRFDDLRWLAGALAVAASSVIMSATKTVHPPAGATALLAATDVQITNLGWWLLPLVLLAAMLMLGTACVLDNIQRRFPVYWWTPADLTAIHQKRREAKMVREQQPTSQDLEKGTKTDQSTSSDSGSAHFSTENNNIHPNRPNFVPQQSQDNERIIRNNKETTTQGESQSQLQSKPTGIIKYTSIDNHHNEIIISSNGIMVPEWMDVDDQWELAVLEIFRGRLAGRVDTANSEEKSVPAE